MVLTLYGYPVSATTLRVAIVLHEKKVPFKFVSVDLMTGEHQGAAHVAKQPFGLVPYIDDDGFILYESRAICQYIATKYADQGTPLLPTELKANAIAQQAISIEISYFSEFADKAVFEKMFKPGLTLADLYHLPYGTLLGHAGSDVMSKKPNVDRWFKELSSRPSWVAVKDGVSATA